MANNDIRQKIVLDGEKEYRAALREAQRNLRTLRSELKAETAEMGNNATAQQKNEARVKSLQKQIKEQERIVKTYRDALEEVREKYGDNEDAIAKWEQKLNDARTALANMKNSLADTGDELKGIEDSAALSAVATNSLADSLSKIGDAGEAVSSTLENLFSNTVSSIREAVSVVVEEMTAMAAKYNNVVDLAGYWNTDVNTIQKYSGAVSNVSGSLEDLNQLVTKINSVDEKKIASLTGVSGAEYSDRWEYAMAVMDALSQMDTLSRNSAGFEIFGKGATKMFDLANDWQTVKDSLDEFDAEKGGFGPSEEDINRMSDLYDKINGIEEKWTRLKDTAMIKLFGDVFMNVSGNIDAILDAFNEYLNAESEEDKQAALEKVKENIVEIFTNLKNALQEGLKLLDDLAEELKGSDDSTARALGNILEKITEALKWFADEKNWSKVEAGFKALIGVWAAGKVAAAVANISSFAAHILTIKRNPITETLFGGGKGGSPAPTTTSGGSGSSGGGGGVLFGKILSGVAVGLGVLFKNAMTEQGNDDLVQGSDGKVYIGQTGEEHKEAPGSDTWAVTWDPNEPQKNVDDVLLDDEPMLKMTEAQIEAAQEYWDALRERDIDQTETAREYLDELFGDDPATLSQLFDLMDSYINMNGVNWDSIEDLPAWWWTQQQGEQVSKSDLDRFSSLPGEMQTAVQKGAAEGVSGLSVTLDGYTVGRIVAPYVSEQIARDMATVE